MLSKKNIRNFICLFRVTTFQEREKDYFGNFAKKIPVRRVRSIGPIINSTFDNEKQYALTELGKQSVRYTEYQTFGLKNGEALLKFFVNCSKSLGSPSF